MIRKKIRSEDVFFGGDIAVYRDLTWKIGFAVFAVAIVRETISIGPIHFNVINVPIARFVSWSNLQLQPSCPAPSVHPGVYPLPLPREPPPRNKRVARQKHRSVVTECCMHVRVRYHTRTRTR